ncbi:MAG: hypothetical protein IPF99_36365 [Deltaproteobacteria bacterium]|nr:hypothetical protein [Deltaproteobacteria bacterium]
MIERLLRAALRSGTTGIAQVLAAAMPRVTTRVRWRAAWRRPGSALSRLRWAT